MNVAICESKADAANLVARLIAARLRSKPDMVLGLATGRTMELVYANLVMLHREKGLDFSRARSFNLDEYIGLPADDERSYHHYMNRYLFDHVNIDPGKTHIPNGMAPDLKKEATRYEKLIKQAGGIDLQLLGIGETGHIGFNEPLSAFRSRARDAMLTLATRRQNADMFGGAFENVPERALTLGVGTILEAKELLVLATGTRKSAIAAKAIEGPMTAMVSASAIQIHPSCKVIVDEEAAAALQGRKDYKWQFEHDPDWAAFRDGDT